MACSSKTHQTSRTKYRLIGPGPCSAHSFWSVELTLACVFVPLHRSEMQVTAFMIGWRSPSQFGRLDEEYIKQHAKHSASVLFLEQHHHTLAGHVEPSQRNRHHNL